MNRAILLAALAAAAPRGAQAEELLRADQIPDKARQLAERGRAYHEAGDYPRAIASFKEAYVLAPSPGLLFNLAQAYRLSGDCDNAAWMYHRYLDTNPSSDRRAIAESHLATVEKCGHGLLHVAITPVQVEAKLAPPLAAPTTSALAVTSASDSPSSAHREKQIGIAMIVGGSAMLAGAAYYAYDAYDASNAVSDLYKNGGKGSDVASEQRRGESSTTIAEYLGLGGAVAAVAGVAVYLHGRRAEQLEHVAVMPTPRGGSVSVSWQF